MKKNMTMITSLLSPRKRAKVCLQNNVPYKYTDGGQEVVSGQ